MQTISLLNHLAKDIELLFLIDVIQLSLIIK